MAFREVTRLADRTIVECWLCEGAPFEDRFWHPDFVVHQKVRVEMAPRDITDSLVMRVPISTYLAPDPAHPNAAWHVHAGSRKFLTYNTASKNLEPNDVCLDGARIRWAETNGIDHDELASDVTVSRDGQNKIVTIERKQA